MRVTWDLNDSLALKLNDKNYFAGYSFIFVGERVDSIKGDCKCKVLNMLVLFLSLSVKSCLFHLGPRPNITIFH